MFVADPPAVTAPAQRADQLDVIEVVGTRRGQALKIDRRTYQVQQTPHSRQKDAIQLLRGLPAVTVSPDDSIALLGSSNVRIFVDGRPYLGDSTQFLRTLHGSDVERIEIMTNPSAQYSAEGSAGIINFVLRKTQARRVSGTVSGEIRTPPAGHIEGSVKFKKGKWTLEVAGEAESGRGRSTYGKVRSIERVPGGQAIVDEERGGGPSHEHSAYGSAKVTYDIEPKTSISANVIGISYNDNSLNRGHFRAVTPDFAPFDEHQMYATSGGFLIGELALDHKGSRDGETLTASLTASRNPRQPETDSSEFSTGGSLFTERVKGFYEQKGQVDWQHPMGKGQILSLGGVWDRSKITERYHFTGTGTGGLPGFTAAHQFAGVDDRLSAYATFQQPVGSWTVMPGLRIERDNRRISSLGHPDVTVDRTDVFPTLHIDHALSKEINLTLSYSKRIDRPELNELRPYAVVEDVLNVKQGNPHLQNQSTDAYEVNLHYHRGKLDGGVILYDRETSRLWSTAYTVVDGINVFSQVNSGHSRDSGAEIDLSTPVAGRVKVSGNVNLFDQRVPVDSAAGRATAEQFRFTTNTTLEWDGPDRGDRPGDVAQLQWMYNSPYRQFDIRYSAWNWLSLSYTHSFGHTLALTGTANYQSLNRHYLDAPLVQERFWVRRPVEFKLKLLKTFGKP
ncbi:outer membrane beta-barrel family protein [Sphingomonas sp.]|uniref:TonB-dependent receptor n=1 Tax=Sphingomonas sp. TaxID=28214 RepID=UPI0025DF5A92|nr:outer membrane beta-barrel family protein [Sphingomonas sp.]MBV9527857.1 TonB-dependent receptor [Sphingomonas sp.]